MFAHLYKLYTKAAVVRGTRNKGWSGTLYMTSGHMGNAHNLPPLQIMEA